MKIKRKTKVAALIVLLLAILPSYVRAYTIDGPSMSPTFWLKDKVVAIQAAYDLRFPYTETSMFRVSDPNRGDLIIYYDLSKETIAAKRVIGIPGDTIELRENVVYINDLAADQKKLSRTNFDHVPKENGLANLVLEEQLDGNSHLITYAKCDQSIQLWSRVSADGSILHSR